MAGRDYIPKTSEEVEAAFITAFEQLVRAGISYDAGDHAQVLVVSTLVYLFVHDHGRSAVSLLTQAGHKNSIRYRDTGTPLNPKNLLTEHPLASVQIVQNAEGQYFQYLPVRDTTAAFIGDKEGRFGTWWEAHVLRDPKRREFSRKNLVFFFRNKMGGAHASEGYDRLETVAAAAFADLAQGDAGGWIMATGQSRFRPEYGVQFATVRQIGWELEQTLRRHCSNLVGDRPLPLPSAPRMIPVR